MLTSKLLVIYLPIVVQPVQARPPLPNNYFHSADIIGAMPESRSLSTLGDPRWISASPHFATYAPLVVVSLLVLSIIQEALGAVWVSTLQGRLILYVLLYIASLSTLSTLLILTMTCGL
jgi:hypothetical protein